MVIQGNIYCKGPFTQAIFDAKILSYFLLSLVFTPKLHRQTSGDFSAAIFHKTEPKIRMSGDLEGSFVLLTKHSDKKTKNEKRRHKCGLNSKEEALIEFWQKRVSI